MTLKDRASLTAVAAVQKTSVTCASRKAVRRVKVSVGNAKNMGKGLGSSPICLSVIL
jgi:hypothetical protein